MGFRDAVPGDVWQELIAAGRLTRYRSGDVLVRQGDRPKRVVVLTSGGMKVVHLMADGPSSVLALRGPGELVGELGVILDKPHSAMVTAIGASTGYRIAAPAFRSLAEKHNLQQPILQLAVDRMHEAERFLADLQRPSAADRLRRLLVHLADRVGRPSAEGLVIELGMPRDEMATMAAMRRSSAIEILVDLQERGLIVLGRSKVTVKDVAAIEAMITTQSDVPARRRM